MNCMLTGVSRGIGRATITELLRQGHSVWGVSRTAISGLSEKEKKRFRHSVCDVGDSESRRRVAEEMDAARFWPDAVILNAAIEYEEDKAALSWGKMQEALRINVEGVLFWISHWMDHHSRRPMQFVGVSSLLALWPNSNCPAYSTSKAAISMAFRALRLRHAEESVDFKLLYLGPVQTSLNPRFTLNSTSGWGVARPEAVAQYIANTVLPNRRFTFYYPWTTGLVCRLGGWMPDLFFERVTRPLSRWGPP